MEDKTHKVFHSLGIDGKYAMYKSDLQYDDGIPYVVGKLDEGICD